MITARELDLLNGQLAEQEDNDRAYRNHSARTEGAIKWNRETTLEMLAAGQGQWSAFAKLALGKGLAN